MKYQITSESVTEGHPDKICDQISDAILDALLEKDPMSRVAIETCVTRGLVLLMGEVSSKAHIDMEAIARKVIIDIGYDSSDLLFDGNSCAVLTSIHEQSSDISLGVNNALESRNSSSSPNSELGAGDQGMMFGYACNETDEFMPLALQLSHSLTREMAKLRKNAYFPWMLPDGKAQVTVSYEGSIPKHIDNIVLSTQHKADISIKDIEHLLKKHIITPLVPQKLMSENTLIYINPTGRFVLGGPASDSGLTGRKIIVDSYGGYARHGGGAFSGKDPTKVDRSAAYACRYVAKNLVAANLCERCEVAISYAIGVASPVSFMIDTKGTGLVPDEKLESFVQNTFDLRPSAIIDNFALRRPIYKQTATYGHFGRNDLDLPWEKLDAVDKLRAFIS